MTEHSQSDILCCYFCLYIHKLLRKTPFILLGSVAFILYTDTVHWGDDSLGNLQDLTPLQILRLIVSKDEYPRGWY